MKTKHLVYLLLMVGWVAVSAPKNFVLAHDNGEDSTEPPASSETPHLRTPEPSETPEHEDISRPSVSAGPEHTPETNEADKNAAERTKHGAEKIAEAQKEVDKLNAAVKTFVGTLPQSVQEAVNLSNLKLNNAKADLASGKSDVSGQAEAAKSIAERGLEMLNNEHEADSIKQNLDEEIDNEDISQIDVNPASGSMGVLRIRRRDKSSTERDVPQSENSLFQVNTENGTVGVHIASGSKVILDNDDLDIESELPVSVDVRNKKVFVQVASGSEELKVLPAKALSRLSSNEKPDIVEHVTLQDLNGAIIFEVAGTRETKLFGLVPLTINTTTALDSQTGSVVSVDNPWFIRVFGFLFQ